MPLKTSTAKSNRQSSLCSSVIGKPYLKPPPATLHTVDRAKSKTLYNKDLATNNACRVHLRERFEDDCLFVVNDLLSKAECKSIVKNSASFDMQNVEYAGRSNSRLVIFDVNFAQYIWKKISGDLQQVFQDENIRCEPHGFDVLRGDWSFASVNKAVRLNKYTKGDVFGVHRDAQFCPSGDHRSMLSLVIYLNDDFKGGETNFHVKTANPTSKRMAQQVDMPLLAELALNKAEKLTKKVVIKPEIGKAVLFSQAMLHESTRISSKKCKYILKTDIMVSRAPVGFRVHELEEKDYLKCINYFRTAQELELKPKKSKHSAAEYYERCLRIRYAYPTRALRECFENQAVDAGPSKAKRKRINKQESMGSEVSVDSPMETDEVIRDGWLFQLFPTEVWLKIFSFIESEADAKNMVKAFPPLMSIKQQGDKNKMTPKVQNSWGINAKFYFADGDFVANNLADCCRVIALYAVFLLGHDAETKTYVVNYNQAEESYVSVELEDLLSSVFYNKKCYGACYKVTQQQEEKHPKEDFENSVDRRHMYMVHGRQFTGIDLENMQCVDLDVLEDNDSNAESDEDTESNESDEESESENQNKSTNLDEDGEFSDEQIIHYAVNHNELTSNFKGNIDPESCSNLDDLNLPGNNAFLEYKKRRVGGAVVRKVKKPITIENLCICDFHDPDNNAVKHHFRDLTFNHLVFDFSAHKLTVERKMKRKCCPFDEQLEDFLSDPLFEDGNENNDENERNTHEFDWKYTVRIGELSNNAASLSFNHASCQCVFPSFRLNEFISMSSYPYLNHIHIGLVKCGKGMMAYTSYGGIAAL